MKKASNPHSVTVPPPPPFTVGPEAFLDLARQPLLQGGRVLLLGGEKALAAGLLPLQEALAGAGCMLTVMPFSGESTMDAAKEAAHAARSVGACAVMGMGGGRALDTAKAGAHFAGLPVFTLPTIPATCAAVTALSVVHQPGQEGYDPFLFLDGPPAHAYLHTRILAASPPAFLRAGIGDSLAKHVEASFKATGAELPYSDLLGLSVARAGYDTLLSVGAQALSDACRGSDSAAYRLAVQCCVVNTGLVSLLVREPFNGGLAHALYYVLHELPAFAAALHGEMVAWGSLVQLCLERKIPQARALRAFLRALGSPASLQDFGTRPDEPGFLARLPLALRQSDMEDAPVRPSLGMLLDAVRCAEALDSPEGKEGADV